MSVALASVGCQTGGMEVVWAVAMIGIFRDKEAKVRAAESEYLAEFLLPRSEVMTFW